VRNPLSIFWKFPLHSVWRYLYLKFPVLTPSGAWWFIEARPPSRLRRTQWNYFVSLSGLSTESPDKQVQTLILHFSHETLIIVENFVLTTEQCNDGEAIISAIKHFIDCHINEFLEWHNLCRCMQQHNEVFHDFLVVLLELQLLFTGVCS